MKRSIGFVFMAQTRETDRLGKHQFRQEIDLKDQADWGID